METIEHLTRAKVALIYKYVYKDDGQTVDRVAQMYLLWMDAPNENCKNLAGSGQLSDIQRIHRLNIMDVNLHVFKANCGNTTMGGLAIHRGRRMTESETRMAVNYGIETGIELGSQIPDEVLDAICDPYNSDYVKYDDTPHFFTLATLSGILSEIAGYRGYLEMTVDELITKIAERI